MVNPFFSNKSNKNLYGAVPNPTTIFFPFKSAIDEIFKSLSTTTLYVISELVVAITSISIPLLLAVIAGKSPYAAKSIALDENASLIAGPCCANA